MCTDHKIIGLCSRLKFRNFPEFESASYWCSKLTVNVPVHVSILWSSTMCNWVSFIFTGVFYWPDKEFSPARNCGKSFNKKFGHFFQCHTNKWNKERGEKPHHTSQTVVFFCCFFVAIVTNCGILSISATVQHN